jgi:hypothetical protein
VVALPSFTLADLSGSEYSFPRPRHTLLVFVDAQCPASRLVVPVAQATDQAFGGPYLDVLLVGPERAANERLVDAFALLLPVLGDADGTVSAAYGIATVPTAILADAAGVELWRSEGWVGSEWQALHRQLISLTRAPAPLLPWTEWPERQDGCRG